MNGSKDIRCGICSKKLGFGQYVFLQIKCPRCKTMNSLRAQAEYFVWGSKGAMAMDYSAPCLPGVYTYSAPSPKKRLHMTEKPLQLMVDLMKICKPDCTVLDPFMGAATTGVAALQSGRKFIGMELHSDYFKISCDRIEKEMRLLDSKK